MTRQRAAHFLRTVGMIVLATFSLFATVDSALAKALDASATTHYRYATIDGVKIFYREAGPADGPVVVFQYTDGVRDVSRISPDNWVHDQALLDRPGNREIQLDLFYDYRTNVRLYPDFQRFFREHAPPAILVWGRNDKIFPAEGAHAYRKDLPEVEFHLFDTGHFALEDKLDEIGPLIRDFLDRMVARHPVKEGT